MSRNYENINELDRKSLEALLTKITYDAYNKGVNFGLAKGDERTEERIIKLLEELKEYWSEKVEFDYGIVSAINADEAIAAIKGENNG